MYYACAVLFLFTWQGADYRVQIQPIDFQEDNPPETYIKFMNQIETDGTDIFVMAEGNPFLLQISSKGKFVRTIGHSGQGPGELGSQSPSAISVIRSRIWVLTEGKAIFFEKGKYISGFKLPNIVHRSSVAGDRFAFDREHVLLPLTPTTGHLAGIFDYGGEPIGFVGDIIPFDEELYSRNPIINETLWARDNDFWYCLFRYRPMIRKFDRAFRLIGEFTVRGPEVDIREEEFFQRRNLNSQIGALHINLPHFLDFKVFGSHLFLECKSTLYQIDKNSGETLSRTHFFGKGPEFAYRTPGKPLGFRGIIFLPPNRIVLPDAFEHDLWTAELPFLQPD